MVRGMWVVWVFVASCGSEESKKAVPVAALPVEVSADCRKQIEHPPTPATEPQRRAEGRRLITEAIRIRAADPGGSFDRLCRAFVISPHPAVLVEMAMTSEVAKRGEEAQYLRQRALDLAGPKRQMAVTSAVDPAEVAFARNDRHVGRDARLYDAGSGVIRRVLPDGEGSSVFGSTPMLSADGSLVARKRRFLSGPGPVGTAVNKDELVVRDTVTGNEVATIRGTGEPGVAGALFLPNDRAVLALQGGGLEIWDLVAKRMVDRIPDTDGAQWGALDISANGNLLAMTGRTKNTPPAPVLAVADLSAKRIVWKREPARGFAMLAIRPDGRRLATLDPDGNLALWDATSGQWSTTVSMTKTTSCSLFLAYASADHGIATACGNDIVLWSEAGAQRAKLHSEGTVQALAFLADGRRLAARVVRTYGGTGELGVELFDAATGARIDPVERHLAPIALASLSPDGTKLAAAVGAAVFVVPLAKGVPYVVVRHAAEVSALAFTANGHLISVGRDGKGVVHDLTRTKQAGSFSVPADAAVAILRDGTRIAVAKGREVSIVTLGPGTQTSTALPAEIAEGTEIPRLIVSGDGRYLAAELSGPAPGSGSIVWDLSSETSEVLGGDVLGFGPDHKTVARYVTELRVTEDAEHAQQYQDEQIVLHNLETGADTIHKTNGLEPLAFSRSGRLVALSRIDATTLWDPQRDRVVGKLATTGTPVAFSNDGKLLILADDSTFRFFDAVAKGKERARVVLREDGGWFEAASENYDAGGGLESKLRWRVEDIWLPLVVPVRGGGTVLADALRSK